MIVCTCMYMYWVDVCDCMVCSHVWEYVVTIMKFLPADRHHVTAKMWSLWRQSHLGLEDETATRCPEVRANKRIYTKVCMRVRTCVMWSNISKRAIFSNTPRPMRCSQSTYTYQWQKGYLFAEISPCSVLDYAAMIRIISRTCQWARQSL